MKYKPHDYQQFTTQFIIDHPQAAIILGMGMGKTIITLTALQQLIYNHFQVRKALIIAPLRVARDTWPTELTKWDHLTDLKASVMVGDKKTRLAALHTDADIYVTNRENIPWLVKEVGEKHWPFDMVIIDELSSFKSHQAQRFKALRRCRPRITRMVGLTGTPAPNSLLDLWAQFALIDGGQRLGKFITHYRDRYFLPDKRNGPQVYTWKLKNGADEEIYRRIEDITVSMRTTDHLTLPELTITDYPVAMTATQAKQYKDLKNEMVLELEDQADTIDALNAASLAGKLQQLAGGAIYTSEEDGSWHDLHDAKLDALEDIIEAANGEPILVAFWFKHEKARILERIKEARYLNTAADFHDWNAGRIPVALIHPASAGHGLNLQDGGHLMVWYTLPWSLELYEQANARLFRQGQQHPVTITRILCNNTIDQQIAKSLTGKHVTQDALVQAVAAELKGITQ